MKLDQTIGIWLSSRPYENKYGKERVRPFHDARLYLAGGIYEDFSGFFRLNLEEENSFRASTELATLSYNPSDVLNVRLAWSSITYPDIYDTYYYARQLTLKRNSVISQPFGGADNNGTLSSPRQGIYLSGHLKDFVYVLGYSGIADDKDLLDLSTLSGRLTYEIIPMTGYESFNITVGAFGMHALTNKSNDKEFSRIAGDTQIDIPLISVPTPGVIRLMGSYLWANDELGSGGSAQNYAWYAQAMFVSMSKGSPNLVPIARFDSYTKNDGIDHFGELTLNLTYYFYENFRAQLEYWGQLDVPAGADNDSSTLFQLVFLY